MSMSIRWNVLEIFFFVYEHIKHIVHKLCYFILQDTCHLMNGVHRFWSIMTLIYQILHATSQIFFFFFFFYEPSFWNAMHRRFNWHSQTLLLATCVTCIWEDVHGKAACMVCMKTCFVHALIGYDSTHHPCTIFHALAILYFYIAKKHMVEKYTTETMITFVLLLHLSKILDVLQMFLRIFLFYSFNSQTLYTQFLFKWISTIQKVVATCTQVQGNEQSVEPLLFAIRACGVE